MRTRRKPIEAAAEESITRSPLEELRDLPQRPQHPFRVYLDERGVTIERAARVYLGCSVRTLQSAINEWRRPKRAVFWAHVLGERVEDLFPDGRLDAEAS